MSPKRNNCDEKCPQIFTLKFSEDAIFEISHSLRLI